MKNSDYNTGLLLSILYAILRENAPTHRCSAAPVLPHYPGLSTWIHNDKVPQKA